jgi:hypothetical protein
MKIFLLKAQVVLGEFVFTADVMKEIVAEL